MAKWRKFVAILFASVIASAFTGTALGGKLHACDHVYVHQIGSDQEGFFRFYEREVMPELGVASRAGAGAR